MIRTFYIVTTLKLALLAIAIAASACTEDAPPPEGELNVCRTADGCECFAGARRIECGEQELDTCERVSQGCWAPPSWCEVECDLPFEEENPNIGACADADYELCVDECLAGHPLGNYCVTP